MKLSDTGLQSGDSYRSKKRLQTTKPRSNERGPAVIINKSFYPPRNDIKTPAATAEPITPEMLLAMQY